MNHNYEYQKPVQQRNNLANILGEGNRQVFFRAIFLRIVGVLFAEGDPHKNQVRSITSPVCAGLIFADFCRGRSWWNHYSSSSLP